MRTFVFFTARRKALLGSFVISILITAGVVLLCAYSYPFHEDVSSIDAMTLRSKISGWLVIVGVCLIAASAVMNHKK